MLTVKGLVLSQKILGEQDKFIDILTAEYGVLEILVKGSGKINSKTGSATQLFAYSEFCMNDVSKGIRILNSVKPIQIFYPLRKSVTAVALASYFSQIVLFSVLPKNGTPEILRLFLNCLHYLSEQTMTETHLKAIFELRIASLLGFMPDVVMCRNCGEYLPETIVFSVEDGCFFCEHCVPPRKRNYIMMPAGGLLAVRHIVLSDFEKIFSFRISERCEKPFCKFAEEFLSYHLDREFPTLSYYKAISRQH